MFRFQYAAPSGGRYFVTVIEMNDGTFDAYAATKPENGREIPLAIEPSKYAEVSVYLKACMAAVARAGLTDSEGMASVPDIALFLHDGRIWTAPGKRTDYPQPLSYFLQ